MYLAFLAMFGAIAGSFASAAIYRIPRENLNLWKPARSFCPSCGHTLAWRDNLPILGWLLLRGQCRYCRERFSPGYLVHEVVLAVAFVVAGLAWPGEAGPVALVLCCIALTALWIATIIDFQYLILPDGITLGGIPFGILASVLVPQFQLWQEASERLPWGVSWFGMNATSSPVAVALVSSLFGAAVSFGFMVGFRALFSYLWRQEALGFGDVKYLAAVGAFLGLEGAAWTLLAGVLVGVAMGLLNASRLVVVVRRRHRQRRRKVTLFQDLATGWKLGRLIPFGPSLVVGTTLVMLAPLETRQFFLVAWPNLLQDALL